MAISNIKMILNHRTLSFFCLFALICSAARGSAVDEHVKAATVSVQTIGFDEPDSELACQVSYEFARFDVEFTQPVLIARRSLVNANAAESSQAAAVLLSDDPFGGFGTLCPCCQHGTMNLGNAELPLYSIALQLVLSHDSDSVCLSPLDR